MSLAVHSHDKSESAFCAFFISSFVHRGAGITAFTFFFSLELTYWPWLFEPVWFSGVGALSAVARCNWFCEIPESPESLFWLRCRSIWHTVRRYTVFWQLCLLFCVDLLGKTMLLPETPLNLLLEFHYFFRCLSRGSLAEFGLISRRSLSPWLVRIVKCLPYKYGLKYRTKTTTASSSHLVTQ